MENAETVDAVARALHSYWLGNFGDPNRDRTPYDKLSAEMRAYGAGMAICAIQAVRACATDTKDSHLTNSPSVVASWWRAPAHV